MSKIRTQYLEAVGNRCSISDGTNCLDCKAVSASVEYIEELEAELTKKDELLWGYVEQSRIAKNEYFKAQAALDKQKEHRCCSTCPEFRYMHKCKQKGGE